MTERIISVVFSGDDGEFEEAIVAYRHNGRVVMVGGNDVTLTFQEDELLALLTDAKEEVNDIRPE